MSICALASGSAMENSFLPFASLCVQRFWCDLEKCLSPAGVGVRRKRLPKLRLQALDARGDREFCYLGRIGGHLRWGHPFAPFGYWFHEQFERSHLFDLSQSAHSSAQLVPG